MWTILTPEGSPIYWNPSWDAAVTWAMKQGGDLDVLFQEFGPDLSARYETGGLFVPDPNQLVISGDIDIHGDLT